MTAALPPGYTRRYRPGGTIAHAVYQPTPSRQATIRCGLPDPGQLTETDTGGKKPLCRACARYLHLGGTS